METEALKQLQLFHNSNDAFERRGFSNAVTMLRQIIEGIYNVSKGAEKSIEKKLANSTYRGDDDNGRREERLDHPY